MTKIKFAIAAVLLSSTAAFAGPAPEGAATMSFNGCEAYQVEGSNYYNFVNPRCGKSNAGAGERAAAAAAAEEGEGEGEGCGEGTPS